MALFRTLNLEEAGALRAGPPGRRTDVPALWHRLYNRGLADLLNDRVDGDADATWQLVATPEARGILARIGRR